MVATEMTQQILAGRWTATLYRGRLPWRRTKEDRRPG